MTCIYAKLFLGFINTYKTAPTHIATKAPIVVEVGRASGKSAGTTKNLITDSVSTLSSVGGMVENTTFGRLAEHLKSETRRISQAAQAK